LRESYGSPKMSRTARRVKVTKPIAVHSATTNATAPVMSSALEDCCAIAATSSRVTRP